jgi:hypothetical protein
MPTMASTTHVAYEHRYLAVAAVHKERVGLPPSDDTALSKAADCLLPGGLGVLLLDSVLVHARNLIEFYTEPPRDNDIRLADFGIPALSGFACRALSVHLFPIAAHVLHMTSARDPAYRGLPGRAHDSTSRYGRPRYRPDWNLRLIPLVDRLFDALRYAATPPATPGGPGSDRGRRWALAYAALHHECSELRADPSHEWRWREGEQHGDEMDSWLHGDPRVCPERH